MTTAVTGEHHASGALAVESCRQRFARDLAVHAINSRAMPTDCSSGLGPHRRGHTPAALQNG